jgi:hypothetical protein
LHLAQLFQLGHQSVAEGAFGTQLIEQDLGFIEHFQGDSAFHHPRKRSLNFGFC